jgi:hypothetical protein
MRTELLSAITTATSTLTQFGVSMELPWEQNGTALFRKNLKKIYVDKTYTEESTVIPTLDNDNVLEDKLFCMAYVACDAKNPPSQLDQLISNILACKDRTGIVNFITESDYTMDKQEDVMVYSFEFRLQQIKQ